MITVACVLKSGGIYTPDWVYKLQAGVKKNLSLQHDFVCLTDMQLKCDCIPLQHDWPRWWSKIELFRPKIFETPVLYLDLDMLVVGGLDDLFPVSRFTMCQDFYRPQWFNSSAMSWSESPEWIYRKFISDPGHYMNIYDLQRPGGRIGDQAFIEDSAGGNIDSFHTRKIVSFKRHVRPFGDIPNGARIIAFHGRPKPPESGLKEKWEGQL